MLKRRRRLDEPSAIDLIEEAFHLLRLAPGGALAAYYLGSLPFALGLLYFWSDMARSAFAADRLLGGSLAMTLLFFWMKTWHAVYGAELLAQLAREPAPRWRPRWLLRACLFQAIVQPAGLILVPASLPLLVAFGWTCAFFASAGALAAGPVPDLKTLLTRSWRLTWLWPMQCLTVSVMFKLLAVVVAINLALLVVGLPFLARTLLGIESVITRAPWAAANSTVLAAVLALTWLCVDPVMKAVYVLRCFYGESLQTAQDLRAELKAHAAPPRPAGLVALLAGVLVLITPAHGGAGDANTPFAAPRPVPFLAQATPADAAVPAPVSARANPALRPADLDHSIEQVIQQREYSWRLPREAGERRLDARNGFARTIESVFKSIESGVKAVGRGIRDFVEWILKQTGRPQTGGLGGLSVGNAMRGVVILVLVILLAVLGWLLFRLWRRRQPVPEVVAEAVPTVPDVADENVGADQLPEEGWVQLARELMDRGERRLALRALYLASLAALAGQNLITLARFKSNRDYQRELARRAHALPVVPGLFSGHVAVFERVWYGRDEVTPEVLGEFSGNLDRLQAGLHPQPHARPA